MNESGCDIIIGGFIQIKVFQTEFGGFIQIKGFSN
jgi:hypothetical protein